MATCCAFRELSKATAPEHCVRACFTGPGHANLILAKPGLLEVYILEDPGKADPTAPLLRRCGSFPLYGNVDSMGVIRFPGASTDSILLCFEEAKLSVVEYDASRQDLNTTAMFSFDERKMTKSRQYLKFVRPEVRVDPEGRCVAMLAFGTQLLVFPVGKRDSLDLSTGTSNNSNVSLITESEKRPFSLKKEGGAGGGGGGGGLITAENHNNRRASSSLSSPSTAAGLLMPFTIDLPSAGVGDVIDFAFLYGYVEPSIVILHEHKHTHAGRIAVRRNTAQLLSISVNLTLHSHSVVSRAERLPHTSYKLVPVLPPLGGCLVLSANVVWHYNNQTVDFGLSVNEFGDKERTYITEESPTITTLECAYGVWLTPLRFFLVNKQGEAFLLTIAPQGTSVRSMDLSRVGMTPVPVGITRLGANFIFLASRLGPSLLLQFTPRKAGARAPQTTSAGTTTTSSSTEAAAERQLSETDVELSRSFAASFTGEETVDLAAQFKQEDDEMKERRRRGGGGGGEQQQQQEEKEEEEEKKTDATAAAATAAAAAEQQQQQLAPMQEEKEQQQQQQEQKAAAQQQAEEDEDAAMLAAVESSAAAVGGHDTAAESGEPARKKRRLEHGSPHATGEDLDDLPAVAGADPEDPSRFLSAEDAAAVARQDGKHAEEKKKRGGASSAKERSAIQAFEDELTRIFNEESDTTATATETTTTATTATGFDFTGEEFDGQQQGGEMLGEGEYQIPVGTFSSVYTFMVRDRLLNIGPIADVTATQIAMETGPQDKRVQLVGASGFGPDSCVTVAMDGLSPDILTKVDLQKKIIGSWSVRLLPSEQQEQQQQQQDDDITDKFKTHLLLSTDRETVVFSTENGVVELEETRHSFRVDSPTLICTNVCGERAVLQVLPNALVLLQAADRPSTQFILGDVTVASAYACDPYVILVLTDASLRLVTATYNTETASVELEMSMPALEEIEHAPPLSALCLFKDKHNLSVLRPLRAFSPSSSFPSSSSADIASTIAEIDVTAAAVSELERILFGKEETTEVSLEAMFAAEQGNEEEEEEEEEGEEQEEQEQAGAAASQQQNQHVMDLTEEDGSEFGLDGIPVALPRAKSVTSSPSSSSSSSSRYYCLVARGGFLEVYTLPSFKRVWWCANLPAGYRLVQNGQLVPNQEPSVSMLSPDQPKIVEMAFCVLEGREESERERADAVAEAEAAEGGEKKRRKKRRKEISPYLFAFLETGDLLIYRAFLPPDAYLPPGVRSGTLGFRLKRVNHRFITRPPLALLNQFQQRLIADATAAAAAEQQQQQQPTAMDEREDGDATTTTPANASSKSLGLGGEGLTTTEEKERDVIRVKAEQGQVAAAEQQQQQGPKVPKGPIWLGGSRFVKFENVSGREGLVIGGWHPLWAFCERGELRLHRLVLSPLSPSTPDGAEFRVLSSLEYVLAGASSSPSSSSVGGASIDEFGGMEVAAATEKGDTMIGSGVTGMTLPPPPRPPPGPPPPGLSLPSYLSSSSSSSSPSSLPPLTPAARSLVVACATPFHISLSPNGLLMCDGNGAMAICALPPPVPFAPRELPFSEEDEARRGKEQLLKLQQQQEEEEEQAEGKKKQGQDGNQQVAAAAAATTTAEEKAAALEEAAAAISASTSLMMMATAPGADASALYEAVWLDYELPVRFIPAGCTVRLVCRHEETETIAALCSRRVRGQSLEETTERSVPIWEDKYELRFYNTRTGALVGFWDDFEEKEAVLCLFPAKLEGKTILALGTGDLVGEDTSTRGRVILLDLYYQTGVATTGEVQRFLKTKPYSQKEKGSVTAIGQVNDLLILCVGQRVLLYHWNGKNLIGKAFYDCDSWCVSVQSVKNFFIIGDVFKSVYFLLWDPVVKEIVLLGKDYDRQQIYATEFLIDGQALSIVTTDNMRNIQVFKYLPNRPDAYGGRKLLARADIHAGSLISKFARLRVRPSGTEASGRLSASNFRTMLIGATLDGGYHLLAPIDELVYRRLFSLHTQLSYTVQQAAGLNPRGYRLMRTPDPAHATHKKGIVDVDFLSQFLSLDMYQQRSLARNIGTTPEQIIENLRELDRAVRLA